MRVNIGITPANQSKPFIYNLKTKYENRVYMPKLSIKLIDENWSSLEFQNQYHYNSHVKHILTYFNIVTNLHTNRYPNNI